MKKPPPHHLGTLLVAIALLVIAWDSWRQNRSIEMSPYSDLLRKLIGIEAVDQGEPRRMIGDCQVLEPARPGGGRHGFETLAAVALVGVRVQVSALHERRKAVRQRRVDHLAALFAQLGFDEGQYKSAVHRCFRVARDADYTKRMLSCLGAHEEFWGAGHGFTVFYVVLRVPHRATAFAGPDIVHGYHEDDARVVLDPGGGNRSQIRTQGGSSGRGAS